MSDVVINVTQPAPVQIGVAQGIYGRQYPGVYLPDLDLQTGIDASYGNGTYYLKEGIIPTTQTIITGNKDSLTMRGQGQRSQFNPNSSAAGSYSIVEAHHAGTVFRVQGIDSVFDNFAVHGDTWNGTYGVRPGIGFNIVYNGSPSTGSGKHTFRHVSVNHVVNAFQAGEAMDDSNCDLTVVEKARFRDCDRIFLSKNRQAMAWTFRDISYENRIDGCLFEFEGGGHFNCHDTTAVCRATILRLNQVNASGLGNNSGIYNFYGLKLDDVAHGSCLVDALSTAYSSNIPVTVNFWGGCISGNGAAYQNDGASLLKLRGGMTVNFFGTRFQIQIQDSIQFNTTGDSGLARVNFDSCVWSGATTVPSMRRNAVSDGNIHLRAVNCQGTDSSDIPPYDATIGTGA